MPIVTVTIHGGSYDDDDDLEDTTTKCSFLLSNNNITLSKVKSLFPYEGTFHFRIKVLGVDMNLKDIDYVWLDILDNDSLPKTNSNVIEMQALIIDVPNTCNGDDDDGNGNDDDDEKYFEDINQSMGGIHATDNRCDRYNVVSVGDSAGNDYCLDIPSNNYIDKYISKGIQKTAQYAAKASLQKMQHGATSIWSALRSTAHTLEQAVKDSIGTSSSTSLLSDTSEDLLASLGEDVATHVNDNNDTHTRILSDLWTVLMANNSGSSNYNMPFQRKSNAWKELGFQKEDPVLDLKSSGILALKSLLYMGKNLPESAHAMINHNKANVKANYPFAVVAVNLTLLLADKLNIRDHQYLSIQAGYWEMFEDKFAFYEIFCICFDILDKRWVASKAVRADFGKIIGEINSLVGTVLNMAPKSVKQFRTLALEYQETG